MPTASVIAAALGAALRAYSYGLVFAFGFIAAGVLFSSDAKRARRREIERALTTPTHCPACAPAEIQPGQVLCRECWDLVSPTIRDAVVDAYGDHSRFNAAVYRAVASARATRTARRAHVHAS